MDVEGIKKLGEEGLCKEDGFLLQLDSGKVYIQGVRTTSATRPKAQTDAQTDKQDRPVVYIHVAKHKIGEQSQKALQRFTVYGVRPTTIRAVVGVHGAHRSNRQNRFSPLAQTVKAVSSSI